MNAKEKTTLEEVRTDIKWLVKSSEETNEHLKRLNNSVARNWIQTMVNKKSISFQWKVIGGGFTLITGAVAIALKGLGVW